MILLVELAQRITRRLDVYFSIVRRRADWASRDMPSASLMITTARVGAAGRSVCQSRVAWSIDRGKQKKRTLEALPRVQIDLLRLRNVLEDLLNDGPVIVPEVTACKSQPSAFEHDRGGLKGTGTHLGVISMW